jgi:hypothetical protein
MVVEKTADRRTGASYLTLFGIIIVLILPLLALAHILSSRRKLRRESQPGRAASASVSSTGTPLTTFNRYGKPGDPINMQIHGVAGQIGAAFATAGWYRADEIDFITSARISIDSILGRAYSTAPVSNLYLYGRKEDLAFERPGHNVRQRDHIRLWNTSRGGSDSRPIWIGSATKDIKVELSKTNHLPTHCIAPDLDDERDLVVSELAQTGFAVEDTTRPGFGKETDGFNGGGDPYFTDGQVAVLTLANVWTSPLATQVRSPLGARIARKLAGFVRNRLPEAGRKRAAREQDRLKQGAQIGS